MSDWSDGHAWKFKSRTGETITLKCAVCTDYKDVSYSEGKEIYEAWKEANKELLAPNKIVKEEKEL